MLKKLPFILALLGILGGVFIAILFGVNEKIFKDRIDRDLKSNPKYIQMISEDEKEKFINKEADKNWRYYQRFHFHATGIGAMSLGILLLLSFIAAPPKYISISSLLTSIGGFFYPFVWLFAGIYGPLIGRDIAKEKFAIFGYMGGLFLLGTLLTIVLITKYPTKFKS